MIQMITDPNHNDKPQAINNCCYAFEYYFFPIINKE